MSCTWRLEGNGPSCDDCCSACSNGNAVTCSAGETAAGAEEESGLEELFDEKFRCGRCRGGSCEVREIVLASGRPLPAVQQHVYLFVSCLSCGSVEIFDRSVLGERAGVVLDILYEYGDL